MYQKEQLIKLKNQLAKELGILLYIGGSYALKKHYGVLSRNTNDIDLVSYLAYNEKAIKRIKEDLSKNPFVHNVREAKDGYHSMTKDEYKHSLNIKFEVGDQTFNIINDISGSGSYIHDWSGDYVPLMAILDAKKQYNRSKDRSDLLEIINNIIK